MKKTFLLLILLSAPLTCFATFAKFYIGGFGGMNVIGSDLGSIVGAAVGYRYSRNVRFEGEVAYRRNTYDEEHLEGSNQKVSLMANVLFDAPIFRVPIVPYFGAGIGGGWNFNKFTYHVQTYTRGVIENKTSDSEGVFVYQGIAGLTLYSGRKVHASLEYRFFSGNHLAGNHAALIHVKRFF